MTAADFDTASLPTTAADLPPHRAHALSVEERAALPVLTWEAYTQYPHLRAEAPEGTWFIGPCRGQEPAPVSFQLPLDEGETPATLYGPPPHTLDQVGGWRRMARMRPEELGYVITQELAQWAIDGLRRTSEASSSAECLEAAGFVFQHRITGTAEGLGPTDVFYKSDARGLFCLFRTAHSVHLTREKRGGGTSWLNLLRFRDANVLQDGRLAPAFWPAMVAQPMEAAVCIAAELSQIWKPEPSSRRRPKT